MIGCKNSKIFLREFEIYMVTKSFPVVWTYSNTFWAPEQRLKGVSEQDTKKITSFKSGVKGALINLIGGHSILKPRSDSRIYPA